MVDVKIPIKFKPLLTEHYRYKLYWGGRAGGKSFAFADSLIIKARMGKFFIACVREVQNSIRDSVYKLLKDRVDYYGFDDFKFYEDRIENILTGSKFVFKGLKDQNSQNIKSLEGVDVCWIEEGQSITKKSWDILNPTIRKQDSEIWISMNRERENDPIWKAVGAHPDSKTLVVKTNYYDNPHCPEDVVYLALKCKKENLSDYEHIWLGAPANESDMKLIAVKDVMKAFSEQVCLSTSPLVIGVDVARFGDDKTVLCYRRGRDCFKIEAYSKLSTVDLANKLTNIIKEEKPARVFLDLGNNGAGVYDILKDRGFFKVVRGVNFGAKAINDDRYANKRAEMWGMASEWLKSEYPVHLVQDDELCDDLCSVCKSYDGKGRLQLENKEKVKDRLGRSPDKADAFVLTFAEPVYDVGQTKNMGLNHMAIENLFQTKISQEW